MSTIEETIANALKESPGMNRLELAARCGYSGKRGSLTAFYQAVTKAIQLEKVDPFSAAYRDHLHAEGFGCSPIIERGRIVGRHELRISPRAREQAWTVQSWEEREREEPFDNMDAPYEVMKSWSDHSEHSCHVDYACAVKSLAFEGSARQIRAGYSNLLRPAYRALGDDENGKSLEEFLQEYGEEPAELVELVNRTKKIHEKGGRVNLLEVAIGIALDAHAGKVDKGGHPYILHPLRVMQSLSFSHDRSVNELHACIAAVLHDVIEDHEATWPASRLRSMGIPEEVLVALAALSKRNGELRPAAALRAAANPIARLVKLADVTDNMNVWRIGDLKDWRLDLLSQYQEVREILEKSFNKKR